MLRPLTTKRLQDLARGLCEWMRGFPRAHRVGLVVTVVLCTPSALLFSSSINVLYLVASAVGCFLWLVVATVMVPFRWRLPSRALGAPLVPVLCFGLLMAIQWVQISYAKGGMVSLGESCQQFFRKYGHYPQELSELVPEFRPSVPKAGFGYLADDFRFDGFSNSIYFSPASPFERMNYHVDTGKWSYYND